MLREDILIPGELEINPYTYLDIVLKYEPYLRLINYFGGYMFLQHIYKFLKKSDIKIFKDIHSMQEKELLKIKKVNNNNYVILMKTSLRYLKKKSNVSYLQPPTSTQLKTCCYLAEYISNPNGFFYGRKPYDWFLEKYKIEIENYKTNNSPDMEFLIKYKAIVKLVKNEEVKSDELTDCFAKLNRSRIYFDNIKDEVVSLIILDFERSNSWIYKASLEKIEPIFKTLYIYKGYDIKILTSNKGRKERLLKDINNMQRKGLYFLKNISIVNLDTDRFFQSTKQKESYLKDIDKFDIAILQEKLKLNSK